jgi:hypothetical protein
VKQLRLQKLLPTFVSNMLLFDSILELSLPPLIYFPGICRKTPVIEIDDNCCKLVRTGFLVDTNAQFCFNEALGSLISAAFDMSTIDCKDLNKTHYAAHSQQI